MGMGWQQVNGKYGYMACDQLLIVKGYLKVVHEFKLIL